MLAEKTFSYENENLVSVLLPRVIKEETKLSSHLKEADVGSEIDTTSSWVFVKKNRQRYKKEEMWNKKKNTKKNWKRKRKKKNKQRELKLPSPSAIHPHLRQDNNHLNAMRKNNLKEK